ncbi:SRPBCC family protein [Anditalea andensis]|uniref:Activator of Hsp90 ATPase homologue 1/2-like C-terminal domain-containing protein n=1 Tax=Anditalea andensis TaxID=1048983 RepID=A0A074L405_9BACT|nr:SRPBCC domain-containing protein [Anditalea andensis]KEO75934.1 hypothetical protein EL17_00020 [Anditalea andensis]
MNKTIKHQFEFPQSTEVVWEYLTNAELLAQWLMPNDIKPIVGHKFQFQSRPMPKFGFDGIVHCEILEIIDYKKLVYSWKGGMLDSVVVWTILPTDKGTLLTLEHKGFKGIKNLLPYIIMKKGWAKIGKTLFKQLNPA